MNNDDYDPIKDLWDSVSYAYEVIRERKRNGGPGWIPKMNYDDRHDLECASAAFAALIERAEKNHGMFSKQAKEIRREWRSYLEERLRAKRLGRSRCPDGFLP